MAPAKLALLLSALVVAAASAQRLPPPLTTVGWTAPAYDHTTGAGTAWVGLALNHAPTAAVTVTWRTVDGSGRAGETYWPVSGVMMFQPGELFKPVAVPVLRAERTPRTVLLQITAATGAATVSDVDLALLTIRPVVGPTTHRAGELRGRRAQLVQPPPGARLSGRAARFAWTPVPQAREYRLRVGTRPGGTDVFDASVGTAQAAMVGGLPADGRTVYVELGTLTASGWDVSRAVYGSAAAHGERAALTTPGTGAALPGETVTFRWSPGGRAAEYWLDVDAGGASKIFDRSTGRATSATVTGLPTDGRPVTVRLWTRFVGSGWDFYQYAFRAVRRAGLQAQPLGRWVKPGWLMPASLIAPAPGTTLPAGTVTFTWNEAAWAKGYRLDVLAGGATLQTLTPGNATSVAVANLPADGRALTVRLTTEFAGGLTMISEAGYTAAVATGGFTQFQQHNLGVINAYRARRGVAPLVLDTTLSTFAQQASVRLSQDHLPHQHFIDASNAGTLWTTAGFRGSAAENQGDPNGWPALQSDPTANTLAQIDAIQRAMFDEGPGGPHHENMMAPRFTRLGVGLVTVGGRLYLTNDFSQ